MRKRDKMIIVLSIFAFIIALGHGTFDVIIKDYEQGVDKLMILSEHSTNAIIAVAALIAAVVTFGGSIRGPRKRK